MRQRFYKDEETYARTWNNCPKWNVMDAAESSTTTQCIDPYEVSDDRQHKKEAYVVLAGVEKFIHCCLAPNENSY